MGAISMQTGFPLNKNTPAEPSCSEGSIRLDFSVVMFLAACPRRNKHPPFVQNPTQLTRRSCAAKSLDFFMQMSATPLNKNTPAEPSCSEGSIRLGFSVVMFLAASPRRNKHPPFVQNPTQLTRRSCAAKS